MTVTLKMTNPEAAQRAAKRYGAKLIDSNTLEAVEEQQSDVIRWITGTGLYMPPEKNP